MASSATRTAVVTGATSGIGKAVAIYLATQEYNVVLAGRRAALGEEVVETIQAAGGQAIFCQTDVSKPSDMARLFTSAAERFGHITLVINNAGAEGTPVKLSDPGAQASYDDLMGINVRSVLTSLEHATPLLVASGGGAIINVSSGMSVMRVPETGPYTISKAALDAVTRVAAVELAEQNIDVYSLNLYVFNTEMANRFAARTGLSEAELGAKLNPSGETGRPEDVAEFILELVSGGHASRFKSGDCIALDSRKKAGLVHYALPETLTAVPPSS